jgi:hypothetical protein
MLRPESLNVVLLGTGLECGIIGGSRESRRVVRIQGDTGRSDCLRKLGRMGSALVVNRVRCHWKHRGCIERAGVPAVILVTQELDKRGLTIQRSAILEIFWHRNFGHVRSRDAARLIVNHDVAVVSVVDPFAVFLLVMLLNTNAATIQDMTLVLLEIELLATKRMIGAPLVGESTDCNPVLRGVNTADDQQCGNDKSVDR